MIAVDNVSVKYIISYDKVQNLKEYMINLVRGQNQKEDFWALKDVSFQVSKGEVLGVIGRNGAGKSTLLKVISGILKPTFGNVHVKGNIVPMLELGSGFDSDLTGRENIYLNGAILGYTKNYLDERYDDIVRFSELDNFIDIPIRTYSSGMMARLAFAIATVVNPDVLIVDEILSVGDESFQRKSKDRMLELMRGGSTVLFVSHAISQIKEMCDKVIWLEHGVIKKIGQAEEVCQEYAKYYK